MSTVLAGWYVDPQDPSVFRWWDGNAWTEHSTPRQQDSIEAGWYDDPTVPNARRFWDGAAWTDHFEPPQPTAFPPGWYPDPDNAAIHRYWDGAAWTEQTQVPVVFDAELPIGSFSKKKKQRLVITGQQMWWGELEIRWDDVASFNQLITSQNGFEFMYEISILHGDMQSRIVFFRHDRRDNTPRQGYNMIIEQLRLNLGTRVLRGLLEMVDAGQPVRVAGLLMAPEGWAHEEKGQEMIPWSDYAGIQIGGHEGIYVQLFRKREDKGKPKMVTRVKVDQMRSWVIPPIVEEHARRYATR